PKDVSAYDLVVYGHSHQYAEAWVDSPDSGKRTLLLNPGSCGPRRFHQPITMAVLTVNDDGFAAKRMELPHTAKETAPKIDRENIRLQIETVIRETEKGRGVETIARKYGMEKKLVEQIVRLYVTHPSMTADGIMTKMGV
ncbi:MAG: metallophosphoesterase family protein, partial [Clostridia bacterium]|nr:metallophosphoesterase family protein [Clostridia bacterium]